MNEFKFIGTVGQEQDKTWYGVYLGVIVAKQGTHIQAQVPQVLGTEKTNWAPPLTNLVTSAPAIGAIVAIMFMGGDINYPYYLPAGS